MYDGAKRSEKRKMKDFLKKVKEKFGG